MNTGSQIESVVLYSKPCILPKIFQALLWFSSCFTP
jgi:hypothetical protein